MRDAWNVDLRHYLNKVAIGVDEGSGLHVVQHIVAIVQMTKGDPDEGSFFSKATCRSRPNLKPCIGKIASFIVYVALAETREQMLRKHRWSSVYTQNH
jgi:hypothetical protein